MFLNKISTMIDFLIESREDFLDHHYYINSIEYDITHDLFYSDLGNNFKNLYTEVNKIDDILLKSSYNHILQDFYKKLPKNKQEKIKKILDI